MTLAAQTAPRATQTLARAPDSLQLSEPGQARTRSASLDLLSMIGQGLVYTDMDRLIRMSDYPWWWGKVNGYADILRCLALDMETVRKSGMPEGMKNVALANLTYASGVAREVWNIVPR